jgi:Rrf2 family protein
MRLALTRRGDYAVRAALALADAGEHRLSAAAVADRMRIPSSFVSQVMADLSRAGVVSAVMGRGGGYRLARPAAEVTLLDAIQASEGDRRQRTCVLRGSPCDARGTCAVHDTFVKGEDAVLEVLRQTTLAHIMDGSNGDPVGRRG